MKQIGIVGLGNMGMGMARNLAQKGFAVRGYARRPELRDQFAGFGGINVASAAEVAPGSAVVILMVMNAAQVFDVLDGGLADHMDAGSTLVIGATIGPAAISDVERRIAGRAIKLLDMPVSGGRGGAEAGTLTLIAAGDEAVLADQDDVLRAIGTSIFHVGNEPGQGQAVKACLQALIAVSFEGLFEAMVLGAKAGIDSQVLSDVINSSFVGSKLTASTTANIVARRFRSSGSSIDTMHKDVGISMDMARQLGVPMPVVSVALQMFQAGKTSMPDGDNWCVVELLEQMAAARVERKPR